MICQYCGHIWGSWDDCDSCRMHAQDLDEYVQQQVEYYKDEDEK